MRKEKPQSTRDGSKELLPLPLGEGRGEGGRGVRVVTAKHPNHVWHVDLTAVPILDGFWCAWFPFALSQGWPFCWWLAIVLDHHSRRVMGSSLFFRAPTSVEVRACLGRAIHAAGTTPKYLICDKGSRFWSKGYKHWCQRRGIKPRFSAIGKHGSIAVIERSIRTLKETLRRWHVPFLRNDMRRVTSENLDRHLQLPIIRLRRAASRVTQGGRAANCAERAPRVFRR